MIDLQKIHGIHSLSLSHFPPVVKVLAAFFDSNDVKAYLVGGAVRDAMLGRVISDIDIAVNGDARRIARDIAGIIDGRLVVLDDSRNITRVVVSGLAKETIVDVSWTPEDISVDLELRDFGIDAMAIRISDLNNSGTTTVISPYGGIDDIHDGVVRIFSPEVFAKDPLRLLRGPRLASQLGFVLSDDTEDAIRSNAHLIAGVSQERIRDELLKLIEPSGATESLRLLDKLGLLRWIIPELENARQVGQPPEHYWDVFDHSIETVGQVEMLVGDRMISDVVSETPWVESLGPYFQEKVSDGHSRHTMLKLAALLHDIGKPACKTIEASGKIRFLGHHTFGAEVSSDILNRMRIGGDGVDLVSRMVKHHLRPSQMAQPGELPSQRAIYRYYRDLRDVAIDTLFLNLADYLAARGPMLDFDDWSKHCRMIQHIFNSESVQRSTLRAKRLIDGHDIMREFSLHPGPQIGVLLEKVEEAHAGGDIVSKEEALKFVQSRLQLGGGIA